MKRLLAAMALALLLAGCAKYERALEYVLVKFPADRPVYIDSEKNGRTNEVLRVDTGTHQFDLGPEADYRPASHNVMVKDTTVLVPLVLEFRRKDDQ